MVDVLTIQNLHLGKVFMSQSQMTFLCRYHPKCINLTKAECEKMMHFECPECKQVGAGFAKAEMPIACVTEVLPPVLG